MKIRKVNESESPGLDELISYLNEDKDFNGVNITGQILRSTSEGSYLWIINFFISKKSIGDMLKTFSIIVKKIVSLSDNYDITGVESEIYRKDEYSLSLDLYIK